jgi:glutamine cyclotransferase
VKHLALFIASLTLAPSHAAEPRRFAVEIVAEYPHDRTAFTQGLFIADGKLFESTGQYGQSKLREIDLKTGAVVREAQLPPGVFGEGAVDVGGDVVVLTWREGLGYVFDRKTFARKREFEYEGEGWGLARGDGRLIKSDGSSTLQFLDPDTLSETGRIDVTFRGEPLPRLNELEWVDGQIFANVWFTNALACIDPKTGRVVGIVDLRSLQSRVEGLGPQDVLNGVAYDAENKKLYVTGKNWPKLFEVRLVAKQ